MKVPEPIPGPLALESFFLDWRDSFGLPRGDEGRLHGSDLGGCDFATMLRLEGMPQLPPDEDALEYWRRGHFIEAQAEAVFATLPDGYTYERGEIVDSGIVGHLDFVLDTGREAYVIDVSTTAAKSTEWKWSHAIKSAFYALEKGAPFFCEWVFQIGFGGIVKARGEHWFRTSDWEGIVASRSAVLHAIESRAFTPPSEPPEGLEWLCKQYCAAHCWRNLRLPAAMRSALQAEQETCQL